MKNGIKFSILLPLRTSHLDVDEASNLSLRQELLRIEGIFDN